MANYIRKTKDVNLSPKLINILEKISNKSEIAKMLLRTKLSKDDLVDDPIDYLSVSKEDPSKISYIYAEKLEKVHPDECWTTKGRVNAKPAVAIKKFLNPNKYTEKDLDLFTSLFKAQTSHKEFDLKIVAGEEIKKYYGYRSYNDQIGGTLHNSCMKHDNCQPFFQVYIDNPEICQMLVMLDQKGKLMGRALIWKAIDAETGTDVLAMDRIYAVDDNKNMHYFKEWADENGYIYKKEQKWQNCLFFESHGVSKIQKLNIHIKKIPYYQYPYVDTFKFWNEKNSTLSNFLPEKDNGYIRTLMGNDGKTLTADTLALDVVQKMYMHREHLIYLPYLDGRVHADYSIWSETMEASIARDHAIYNEEIKDYIFNEEFNKYNNQTRLNAKKEQIRRLNEQKAQKMVSSKKARLSTSDLYAEYLNVNLDAGNNYGFAADIQNYGNAGVEAPQAATIQRDRAARGRGWGAQGYQNAQGPQGYQGAQGHQGAQGLQGAQGIVPPAPPVEAPAAAPVADNNGGFRYQRYDDYQDYFEYDDYYGGRNNRREERVPDQPEVEPVVVAAEVAAPVQIEQPLPAGVTHTVNGIRINGNTEITAELLNRILNR